MVGYPKREKGTRRNHCIFWGKGEESVLIGAGMGQGGSPNRSGKQPAERMAEWPAPIVCPEGSPL